MHPFFEVLRLSEQADVLFNLRRYEQAAERYGQALVLEPDNAAVLNGLAACYLNLGRAEDAQPLIAQSLTKRPDDAYGHYLMASALNQLRQWTKAIEAINEALRYDPKADYFAVKARIHHHAGHFFETRKIATEGLRLEPQHLECRELMVAALQIERKPIRRETEILLELAPDWAWAHVFRGYSHLYDDEITKALERFREAMRLDPNLIHAHEGWEEANEAYHQSWGERLYRLLKNAGRSSRWAFNILPLLAPTVILFLLVGLLTINDSSGSLTWRWLGLLVLFVTGTLVLLRQK